MCGIAGYLSPTKYRDVDEMVAVLRRMGCAIIDRGPDDAGEWIDSGCGIGLSHRRLSVLELSAAGHQPMQSASGRHVISFNGEIYNHLEIRSTLEAEGYAPVWRGRSDTETLLAAIEAWGTGPALQRTIGMFAFAVWDRSSRTLTLARDRLGEKPIYYGWQDDVFLFGSELKALRAHPAFRSTVNRGAVCLFLRHNYIPAPFSIYSGVHKLQPGSLLIVSLEQRDPRIECYWSGLEVAQRGNSHPFAGDSHDAVRSLDALLRKAIGQQMVADVPLGAFLSGGVDSSTVVALMQAQSSRPVQTFSIGFNEDSFDEAVHAKRVAQHLKTDHHELYVTATQALEVVPLLPQLYDEPFADSSQVPTFLLARLAHRSVTVTLSGDGGDELFCGYTRYLLARRLWAILSLCPISLRRAMARRLASDRAKSWSLALGSPVPAAWRDKWLRMMGMVDAERPDEFYRRFVSQWASPEAVVIGANEPDTLLQSGLPEASTLQVVERMMALDLVTYLPDDNLVKVDRATMGNSLESRVPLLDHRVVEFAWSLPQHYKLRNGVTKWPLRQVLYQYVPRELIERPKRGFRVPIAAWLRGPLREWAESLLAPARLRSEDFFVVDEVRRRWDDHVTGRRDGHHQLWCILMFQAWLDAQRAAA